MQHYLQRVAHYLPAQRLRGWSYSLFFGLVVVATFYTIQWLLPKITPYYEYTTTILFIVISVLILFPAREAILRRLLKRSEFERQFGFDSHHIDLVDSHIDHETLVQKIFPELLSWLRVSSGKIATLEESYRHLSVHSWRWGRLRKRSVTYYKILNQLNEIFRQQRRTLYIHDLTLPPDVRLLMQRLHAQVVQPFLYRKRLLGFLILHEVPSHPHAQSALDAFAHRAAVAIHNYLLSCKVADAELYRREFLTASRIRRMLYISRLPEVKGLVVKRPRNERHLLSSELIAREDGWLLLLIATTRVNSGSGLVLAGAIGHIFSLLQLFQGPPTHRVLSHLRDYNRQLRANLRLEFLLIDHKRSNGETTIIVDGSTFDIFKKSAGAEWQNLDIRLGQRNISQEVAGFECEVHIAGDNILSLEAEAVPRQLRLQPLSPVAQVKAMPSSAKI